MRKPFEPLEGWDHRSQPRNILNEANAAIAQDKEYAYQRIAENAHEGEIYRRERDSYKKAKEENDERFQLEAAVAKASLAEAVEVLEFYANKENYLGGLMVIANDEIRSKYVGHEGGTRARKCLQRLEGK